jgi:hypothetical protein
MAATTVAHVRFRTLALLEVAAPFGENPQLPVSCAAKLIGGEGGALKNNAFSKLARSLH